MSLWKGMIYSTILLLINIYNLYFNTCFFRIVRNKAAEKAKHIGSSLNGAHSPQPPQSNPTSVIAHAPPAAHESQQRPSYSINGILGLQSAQQQQDHSPHKRKRDENGKLHLHQLYHSFLTGYPVLFAGAVYLSGR